MMKRQDWRVMQEGDGNCSGEENWTGKKVGLSCVDLVCCHKYCEGYAGGHGLSHLPGS